VDKRQRDIQDPSEPDWVSQQGWQDDGVMPKNHGEDKTQKNC
jgi:hypothetical protein